MRALFLLGLLALPSCEFLMDEFFTLQKAPPRLDQIDEQMRGH